MAVLRMRGCSGVRASWVLAVLGASLLVAGSSRAADITWVSITPSGGSDEPFISLLQGAGHTVTRFPSVSDLSDEQLNQLNASDLVIVGRATGSGDFDDATDETNWNQRLTARLLMMSAYITRTNRLGWQAGNTVPDSGPTQLVATNRGHPVFNGITFAADGTTTQNEYNVQIDRGTSIIGNPLVPGGIVIASHPTIADGIAIAEWPAGTTVTADNGSYVLPSNRYFFAGGSREADGDPVTSAGQMDLTQDGQRMFLNFVQYAAIPEPSAFALLALGAPLLLRRSRQR